MRYAVEFACPGYEARDRAWPLGIVAQDEDGIHVKAVPADAAAVEAACGLPAGTVARWEADAASRVMDPVFGRDGEPLDCRDPAWLDRFAGAGMEAKFFFGPVVGIPESGAAAIADVVNGLVATPPLA